MQPAEIMSLLVDACPGINGRRIMNAESQGEDSSEASLFANYLVDRVKKGETDSFPEVFSIVERGIIEGTDETRILLVVGLLENLKNFASWQDMDYSIFEPWLGPETHIAWRWLEKKWRGTTSLADAVRKQTGKSN